MQRQDKIDTRKGVSVPEDFAGLLRADARALAIFEAMRPSCQKSSVKWIEEAKKRETRERRIEKAREMILEYGQRHPKRRLPSQA